MKHFLKIIIYFIFKFNLYDLLISKDHLATFNFQFKDHKSFCFIIKTTSPNKYFGAFQLSILFF